MSSRKLYRVVLVHPAPPDLAERCGAVYAEILEIAAVSRLAVPVETKQSPHAEEAADGPEDEDEGTIRPPQS